MKQHPIGMRRETMPLLAILLTALVSNAQVNFYSKEKEAALGAQLAAEFRKGTTSIDRVSVRDYLERIGGKLASQIPDTVITYSFSAIRENRSNNTHEPNALPGGYIFVPAILFLTAENEAEFAGMLAHAIAHVAARHGTRQATRGQTANLASVPLVFTSVDGANSAIPLGLLTFQRQYELEADKLAVEMMSRAGYDPNALAAYIDRVQPEPATTIPQVRSPLPSKALRIAAIQQTIEKLPSRTYTTDDSFQPIREEVRQSLTN